MRSMLCLGVGLLLAGCNAKPPSEKIDSGQTEQERILAKLGHENDNVRYWARVGLMNIGHPAVPLLVEALQGSNPRARYEAAAGLCGMRSVDRKEAVPALAALIQDPDRKMQEIAIQALSSMRADALPSVPALQKLLLDSKAPASRQAASALARIQGAKAVPVLMKALEAKETRVEALDALAEIGPDAREAIPSIQSKKQDKDLPVREAACNALRRIQKQT